MNILALLLKCNKQAKMTGSRHRLQWNAREHKCFRWEGGRGYRPYRMVDFVNEEWVTDTQLLHIVIVQRSALEDVSYLGES